MKDINDIFNEAPDDRLWNRFEDKLDRKRAVRKLRFYRISAVAAVGAAVIFAVTYFNHILDDHNPHLFASNEGFTSFVLEEIEHEQEGLFNMGYFATIRKAYSEAAKQAKSLSLVGNYVARDGEMSLDIHIKDYTYFLTLAYDGFPELELVSVNGQTLDFQSAQAKTLKMNVEPYGLKVVSSTLLPEYVGYQFNSVVSVERN